MASCLYHYRIMQEHQIALRLRWMSLMSGFTDIAKGIKYNAPEREYQIYFYVHTKNIKTVPENENGTE